MINEQPDYHISIFSEEAHLNPFPNSIAIAIPTQLVPAFKRLIHRALNTNADCHPAFKEFGDMLKHGRVLQDYYGQRSDIKHGRSTQELLLDGTAFELLPLEQPPFPSIRKT